MYNRLHTGPGEERIPRPQLVSTERPAERAFLVAVDSGSRDGWRAENSLAELGQLAATAGAVVVGEAIQRLESPNPATYLGKGKVQEIAGRRGSLDYTLVIFDDELSPTQQRNLENALKVKVLDRTALILDIFAMRAQTREGRLQVELAQAEYLLPRLAGQWSHLERLGGRAGAPGAIGVRGPGETQIETDRRLVRNRISRLHEQIEAVRRHRSLYRRHRARQGMPVIALVGYTNAGKSTLMRTLTAADVLVEDQVFATLDPVTRRLALPEGRFALLTDTVGFIQKLPHALVAAFRATLEELSDADLLLHVLDITHPDAARQSQTVEDTLAELGLEGKPRLTALNKVDRLRKPDGTPIQGLQELEDFDLSLAEHRPDAVLISAACGWGLDELKERLARALDDVGVVRA